MSKLEDGYFYGDSSGNIRFVSYDTLGSGGVFFFLIILATLLIEKLGNVLIDNQWIVLIPTCIAVVVRFLLYDRGSSAKRKVFNILADAVRTLGIYGVLISLFAKVLSCHILDRIFVAIGLGLLFAAAYVLINMACRFFRGRQWVAAHFITSIVSALVGLMIYLNQIGINIQSANRPNTDAITQNNTIAGLVDSLDKITNPIGSSPVLSFFTKSFGLLFGVLITLIPVMIGVAIGKKINRETMAKFDSIGNELKNLLPNDAGAYFVNYEGISYVDKQDEWHSISFEELGYTSFPTEKETVATHYVNTMGKWLLKNIISEPQKYRMEMTKEGLGSLSLKTNEYINRHTLKKW